MARRLPTFEGLDNNHAAAAVRAGVRGVVIIGMGVAGLVLRSHIEQRSRSRDILGMCAFGEQAVMADAVEAVGKDVR